MTHNESLDEETVRDQLIGKAIQMISILEAQEEKLKVINSGIYDLYGDFSPTLNVATDAVRGGLVDLLDMILGEQLASYYLYECGGKGRITEMDGTEWPIGNIDELKKYAQHIRKLYP